MGRRAGLLVLLFGLLSLAFWRGEVELIKGWAGLNWLNGYPWAAVPVCALVAGSVLVAVLAAAPPAARKPLDPRRRARLRDVPGDRDRSRVVVVCESRDVAGNQPRWLMFSPPPLMTRDRLVDSARSVHNVVRGWDLSQRSIACYCDCGPWCIALFVAALIIVMPASWLSLQLLPAHGYTDEIHAIKAGYPTLWTNLLIGGVAAMATRFGRVWTPRDVS